jgi:acetoin:2,6-dichlorophenolindophenol oxidoreductase subunit beta
MLYGRKGEVPEGGEPTPIGRAAVRRQGGDVTIAAALAAVETALAAADELAADGIDGEVIDLRTLSPLDVDTILESVTRTGRLVVVEEGPPTGGYAAEVVATAVEGGGTVAARRVTMPGLPVPFSGPLEDAAVPAAEAVAGAARSLL